MPFDSDKFADVIAPVALFRYGMQRFRGGGKLRLAMTILVKNEADIIEDNIRVHAALGVDCFAVMDNGSTDGTREILERLRHGYEISIIDQREQSYRQRQWMTQLAFHARDHLGADWVISNDADEFWIPRDGNLKQGLDRAGSVVTCRRHNMVLTEASLQPGYRYYDSTYRVHHPIDYDTATQRNADDVSIPLARISPKVLLNPHGLIRIKGGNHRAKHIAAPWSARNSETINVYHYPIRGYAQFERNILNRKQLVGSNRHVSMGPHYYRWLRLLDAGMLEREYDRFIVKHDEIAVMEKFGIIQRDSTPAQSIAAVLQAAAPASGN